MTLGVTLVVAEVAWRVVKTRSYGPATNPNFVLYDPLVGWRYRPDAQVRHRTDDFDVAIRIDAHGRRIGRVARAPHPAIVFVGDSMTFGWGVEGEETFAALVGDALGGTSWNLGVAGFGPDQELLKLRAEGLALAPDAVVVTLYENDVEDVLSARRYGRTKPRFRLDGDALSLEPAAAGLLERYSSFYRSLVYFAGLRFATPLDARAIDDGRRLVVRLVRAMGEATHAIGAPLVVLSTDAPWVAAGLRDAAGVECVDLGPALAAATADGPVQFATDPHWNAHGHRVVAGETVRALRLLGVGTAAGVD